MNAGELPFEGMYYASVIAGFNTSTHTICLNAVCIVGGDAQEIERLCEGTLSHETIHGVLLKELGSHISSGLDGIDGWHNKYEISFPYRSSTGSAK